MEPHKIRYLHSVLSNVVLNSKHGGFEMVTGRFDHVACEIRSLELSFEPTNSAAPPLSEAQSFVLSRQIGKFVRSILSNE